MSEVLSVNLTSRRAHSVIGENQWKNFQIKIPGVNTAHQSNFDHNSLVVTSRSKLPELPKIDHRKLPTEVIYSNIEINNPYY